MSGTLVSSLEAECGSHAPWHILAQVLELVASQGFTPWIGSRACALVVSSCHEVIPGGTKATIVGVDEEGDLPVFTDDGKTMATWCSIWLQVWERQCGPLDHASQPVQHCNCRNRMSKQHRKTHLQSLPMCCCRSVGYFVGALAEVLHSESFANVAFTYIHMIMS